jgi:hypothetical protein
MAAVPTKYVTGTMFEASYAHLDYTWGVDANKIVYMDVLRMIGKFNH